MPSFYVEPIVVFVSLRKVKILESYVNKQIFLQYLHVLRAKGP